MRVPRIFTLSFHRDFFLPLVFRSFGTKASPAGSAFAHHVPLEIPVLFMVAVLAAALGLPAWSASRSVAGGLVGLAGAVAIVALAATSIGPPANRDDLWSGFMVSAFVTCVFLGLTAGLFVGALVWKTGAAKAGFGAAGILAGYLAGIGAGLGLQWLGWLGRLLQVFAIPFIIGLAVLDIVLIVI